ncbi:pyridoxamine 5'-phosphate oxidase family protein [Flavobacterium sp.]|uniref:pyridoxamine 5'-phosphate oxidase family protein n=1 Tax=Flavobacterium sp. TaxID=239 RepID=UPI002B908B86|nr:pyridoxamine 5'-phosphate oxidase family protein [Flavobacterium sp.]HSD07579.1 pyridoxamine 5'-phosphate oxidase family protein [Flavobacterium sp.]
MFTQEVINYIDQSVLCWLATSDKDNFPNVSPKEMFTHFEGNKLLIANIASPNSVANILENDNVCVSFIDVFVEKGFKIKGQATIIYKEEAEFVAKSKPLTNIFSDKFPISAIIQITAQSVEPIIAPSYFLYPEITEEQKIKSAMNTYKVK